MSEDQKNVIRRFLGSIKNAVMAISIDSLKDDALNSVYSSFVEMIELSFESDESES